ncbi:unnamed protein product [Xylocopa violacea]|uniref:Uncharacterized protein n=1 Tax=Xylocopa violacea TaxID=135666 RepID=A0ABP1N532_XYLVO
MSRSEKSVRPVRQFSLQPPAPRRQQIRRQRSAEDEKSLQICASPLARGKRGTSGKPGSERPKVRVAWKQNRQKNEKELEQVEVVAHQIPGRSKPPIARSKVFMGLEKPTILYSRQELAERLRLAWKHREENKANISIFLARGTLDERCDSVMSNCTTITSRPPSPVRNMDDESSVETPFEEVIRKKSIQVLSEDNNTATLKQNCDELSYNLKRSFTETTSEENEVSRQASRKSNVDCLNSRVPSTTLPSIKTENSTLEVAQVSKVDFSSARQKRASFHSGTNQAFLDPIKSPTEFRWNSLSERKASQKSTENRNTIADRNSPDRAIIEGKGCVANQQKSVIGKNTFEFECNSVSEKNVTRKVESKDVLTSAETMTQKRDETNQSHSPVKRTASTSSIIENKNNFVNDKAACSRNAAETRCSSANEKSGPFRRAEKMENQKCDQKSRRTSSAPPQRCSESVSVNNRVQVNIVIDASLASGKSSNQEKPDVDCDDTTSAKVSPRRSIRSAPLKRRSRSARRRFWGNGGCKNDEDGKSRNRSAGRARNTTDFRTMDIVTMVSLVSSADSDSDTENSPRDDKLIDELRSKLPTTSIIKTSINSALSSARKPIKSVSFQNDSFDEDLPKERQPSPKEEKKATQPRLAIVNQRGNGATLVNEETSSWRTDVAGLGLPVLTLIHDIEEPLDVPLTDREKRCLAVPIGDLHDKKRKLLKTRNTPTRSGMEKQVISSKMKIHESSTIISQRMEVPVQQTKTFTNNSPENIKSTLTSPSKVAIQHDQSTPMEPHFQSNKEKECWHLYRKMCDKGVCVSFDTVLRGMLTPTEYRLRQRELLQNL